jgi:hypothetical protein
MFSDAKKKIYVYIIIELKEEKTFVSSKYCVGRLMADKLYGVPNKHTGLYTLHPESSENILILLQEVDLYFSNQNDLRNPKMGSKQSVVVPTEW